MPSSAKHDLVSFAAVYWHITQCSPKKMAAHISFPLCLWFVCGLLKKPITNQHKVNDVE